MARMPKSLRDDPYIGPKIPKMPKRRTRALLKNPDSPREARRPRFEEEIRCDLDKVEELASQNATHEEIAVHLGCCTETVARYAKDPKTDFCRAYKRGQVKYAFWLKGRLMDSANALNAATLKWLSLQAPLNYREQPVETKVSITPQEIQRAIDQVLGMPDLSSDPSDET